MSSMSFSQATPPPRFQASCRHDQISDPDKALDPPPPSHFGQPVDQQLKSSTDQFRPRVKNITGERDDIPVFHVHPVAMHQFWEHSTTRLAPVPGGPRFNHSFFTFPPKGCRRLREPSRGLWTFFLSLWPCTSHSKHFLTVRLADQFCVCSCH